MGDVANFFVLLKEESDYALLAMAVMCTPNIILHFGTKGIVYTLDMKLLRGCCNHFILGEAYQVRTVVGHLSD